MTDLDGAKQGALILLGFLVLVILLSIFHIGEGGDSTPRPEVCYKVAHDEVCGE